METSDSPRTWPASTDTAEPHAEQESIPRSAEEQGNEQQATWQQAPVSLDPRLWPRPYVDQPVDGSQSGSMTMQRFTPAADAAPPPLPRRPPARRALPAAQADGSPAVAAAARPEAPARSGRRPMAARRAPVPATALPPGRPSAPAAPPAGRAIVPPPPVVSRGGRPQPVRAVIGDEIRIPFIWCEFGTCDATYTHPDALGERDLRARALAAGWRHDALGRRACPNCAQHDPTFWTARPPAPAGDWRRAG